jgi:hypothetical protein
MQSVTKLNRDFFIIASNKLTTQFSIPKNSVVKVVKLFYSIPETRNY